MLKKNPGSSKLYNGSKWWSRFWREIKCIHPSLKKCFVVLFTAKENQSPLGLYRNPLTFFFSNPRFVPLIGDVLFCFLHCGSAFVTAFANILRHRLERHSWEIMVYKVLNMDIFLTQMHQFITPPEPCGLLFWSSKSRPPFTIIVKLGRARTFFYITPILFIWK